METIIVTLIILVFVVLNSLPFIAGVLATPAGSVFLGTVHWPGDYFYYLSQFAQGKNSWFTSYDLYTNDFPQKTMVGWVNVFLGRLFSLVGIDHLAAYQLSIVILTTSFLALSYLLIREIFSGEKGKSLIAFILFVTSNAFPGHDFWFNNGIPFNRLGGVPHHLIARTVIVLSLLLALKWWRNKGCLPASAFLILGFILASVEPVHWILVITVLFITVLLKSEILISKSETNSNDRNTKFKTRKFWSFEHLEFGIVSNLGFRASNFLPSVLLFLGGLPMAIYIKRIFANPPYSQLAVWEASQQVNISIFNFILANGPVMMLAIVGMIFIFRNINSKFEYRNSKQYLNSNDQNSKRFVLLIFPLLTIGLFFSPLPRWVGIVNVRFLPAVTTLFLAVLATEGISILARVPSQTLRSAMSFLRTSQALPIKSGSRTVGVLKKHDLPASARATDAIILLILCFILLVMLPSYYVQVQNRIKTEPSNAFFYVTQGIYESFREAEKISSQNDTFLVIWPFNWSFPGITGRRVYEGHSLLTSDYDNKELATRSFFFGDMSKTDMEKMLRVNRIDYVMTYPWTRNINELTNLEKVYDNGSLAIYKVK